VSETNKIRVTGTTPSSENFGLGPRTIVGPTSRAFSASLALLAEPGIRYSQVGSAPLFR